MYKTILVKDLIEEGELLVTRLEDEQFPVTAALWYFVPERANWKLIIVTSAVHQSVQPDAYTRIQRALASAKLARNNKIASGTRDELSLHDVLVMSPESRQFRDLRRTIEGVFHSAGPGQFPDFQGAEFEDAHIYRWPKQ